MDILVVLLLSSAFWGPARRHVFIPSRDAFQTLNFTFIVGIVKPVFKIVAVYRRNDHRPDEDDKELVFAHLTHNRTIEDVGWERFYLEQYQQFENNGYEPFLLRLLRLDDFFIEELSGGLNTYIQR